MLGVLDHLHTRVPPILHRDIKPANLIIRPSGTPALVDFGAVRNVFRAPEDGGSTVVGTYGYMPYEQYMGQASPASDLFALGATFLHLVTGRAPPAFMSDAGRLEVPADLPCRAPLRAVLVRLLAHAPGDRFQSAREARAALLAAPDGSGGGGTTSTPPVVATALAARVGGAVTTLPAVIWSVYRNRKRRLKPFFIHGLPATARVLDMGETDIGFGNKLKRVRYEFEADGRRQRGSDDVLPFIADLWEPGDTIPILYLPDHDYDSVIIATS